LRNIAGSIYLVAPEITVPINTDIGRGNIFPVVFKQHGD
jgi:hypothetical protein